MQTGTTSSQRAPLSNGIGGVFYISESSRRGSSLSEAVLCHMQDIHYGGDILGLRRDRVEVFYRLGNCAEIIDEIINVSIT